MTAQQRAIFPPTVRTAWIVALSLAQTVSSISARADEKAPLALVQEYLGHESLGPDLRKIHSLRATKDGLRSNRHVFAVTPRSLAHYFSIFSPEKGYFSLRFHPDNLGHLGLVLDARSIYFYGIKHDWSLDGHLPVEKGGYIWPVRLTPEQLAHMKKWIADGHGQKYSFVAGKVANPHGGHCMRWLPNAEVQPGVGLFRWLGLRRSEDGHEMKARLSWAANQNLPLIGLCLPDGQHFEDVPFGQLNEQKILGPPPSCAISEVIAR